MDRERERVIKDNAIRGLQSAIEISGALVHLRKEHAKAVLSMLKDQEIEEPHPWEHIWDAPDYTFKGRCRNCGFIHYFIQGHDAQYRFCPQCGEQKEI